ncbi:hypothetical protein NDU88_004855 [Pleurodeles waltl]|uniref:Uncharacterized protein n=1 Tax=Pleurodeles waltl TaxID=8319 RepID=A0AAV7RJX7_PLEWA|nr:hypothetical protein NDU88_004855 [Pleurodeles waltl]
MCNAPDDEAELTAGESAQMRAIAALCSDADVKLSDIETVVNAVEGVPETLQDKLLLLKRVDYWHVCWNWKGTLDIGLVYGVTSEKRLEKERANSTLKGSTVILTRQSAEWRNRILKAFGKKRVVQMGDINTPPKGG